MQTIFQKLTSRKLWLTIAGIATGIAMSMGVDAGDIGTVSGAVVTVVSIAVYIVTEGKIDAASIGKATEKVDNAVERIEMTE